MRRHGRGLVAALEQEEIEVELQEDQVQEELPSDVDLGAEFTEVDNSGGEAIVTDLDSVEEVSDALESIYDVFHEAAGNGGFKIENAAAVNVAVESMLNTIGIKSDNKLIALESLNSTSERVVAVQFAMEGIADHIKNTWNAIIDGIKKLFAWMKEFYKKIFLSSKKVLEKAISMKEDLLKKNIHPNKETFNKPHLFEVLNIEGEVPVNIDPHLKNINDIYASVVKSTVNIADAFKENIKEIYEIKKYPATKYVIVDEDGINNFSIPATKIYKAEPVSDPSLIDISFDKFVPSKLHAFKTPVLFGNKLLLGVVPITDIRDNYTFEYLHFIKSKLVNEKSDKTFDEKEIPVLTKDAAVVVLDAIISLCKTIMEFESKEKEIQKIKDQFIKDAEDLNRSFMVNKESPDGKYFNYAGKLAKFMSITIDQPISGMTSYCAKISRTLLEYVSASLKEYDAGTSVAA